MNTNTKLSSTQKSALTFAILGALDSKYLRNRYRLTRRHYVCNLLLRSVTFDQPLMRVYKSLGRKTQIQMYRILAYIVGFYSGSDYNPSFYRELYGSDIVDTFESIYNKQYKNHLL